MIWGTWLRNRFYGGFLRRTPMALAVACLFVAICLEATPALAAPPAKPGVLSLFDTSGSMSPAPAEAASDPTTVATQLRWLLPDVQFAVAELRDFASAAAAAPGRDLSGSSDIRAADGAIRCGFFGGATPVRVICENKTVEVQLVGRDARSSYPLSGPGCTEPGKWKGYLSWCRITNGPTGDPTAPLMRPGDKWMDLTSTGRVLYRCRSATQAILCTNEAGVGFILRATGSSPERPAGITRPRERCAPISSSPPGPGTWLAEGQGRDVAIRMAFCIRPREITHIEESSLRSFRAVEINWHTWGGERAVGNGYLVGCQTGTCYRNKVQITLADRAPLPADLCGPGRYLYHRLTTRTKFGSGSVRPDIADCGIP